MGSILVVIYFFPSGCKANGSEQPGVPKLISDSVDVDFYTVENKWQQTCNGTKTKTLVFLVVLIAEKY